MHHAITIATPHRGTWLARLSTTRNGREMRVDSAWLSALVQREPRADRARTTCFYSDCDNIVFPSSRAVLEGSTAIQVPGAAHVEMAFRDVVFDEVCRLQRAPAPVGPAPVSTPRR